MDIIALRIHLSSTQNFTLAAKFLLQLCTPALQRRALSDLFTPLTPLAFLVPVVDLWKWGLPHYFMGFVALWEELSIEPNRQREYCMSFHFKHKSTARRSKRKQEGQRNEWLWQISWSPSLMGAGVKLTTMLIPLSGLKFAEFLELKSKTLAEATSTWALRTQLRSVLHASVTCLTCASPLEYKMGWLWITNHNKNRHRFSNNR